MSANDNPEVKDKEPIKEPTIRGKLDDAIEKAKVKIVGEEGQAMTPAEEKISNNAKFIILALFIMVSFIVTLGAWVIVSKPDVSTEVLTIIFTNAITGAFTLGGVLINAIWGK